MIDPTGLSRVELEHVLARDLELGDEAGAEAIRAELATRTWQNVNPYAEGVTCQGPARSWYDVQSRV